MKNKIIVISVPFTFATEPRIPLEYVTLDTFRFITWLKNKNNEVFFINMRSREHFFWKERSAGLHGKNKIPTYVSAKPMEFLDKELDKYYTADEVILQCDFSVFPYLFDVDIIQALFNKVENKLPKAKIYVGGAFFIIFKDIEKKYSFKLYNSNYDEILASEPDEETSLVANNYKIGFFQLSSGCGNKCSFCSSGNIGIHSFSVEKNIDYLKKLEKGGINRFQSLDLNIMMLPAQTEKFIQCFINSKIKGEISFPLGFQPDKITDKILKLLQSVKIDKFVIPFDSGTSESYKKVRKPYTIISSIKAVFNIQKAFGLKIKQLYCPFIIGYIHDDIRSIFRIFFAVHRGGGSPWVFPLFACPGTKEYFDNFNILKNKDLVCLNGDLWPFISEKKIPFYKKLIHFLNIEDYSKAIAIAPRIFDVETMKIFRQEQYRSSYFTRRCLESENSSLQELEKIEREMESDASLTKPRILHISASPMGTMSFSRIAGSILMSKIAEKKEGCILKNLDLTKDTPVFINDEFIKYINRTISYEELSAESKNIVETAKKYSEMLDEASTVIISAPVYNMSLPALFKSFVELAFGINTFLGRRLLDVPVCCIISMSGRGFADSGSIYEKTMSMLLASLGITKDPTYILAENCQAVNRSKEIPQDILDKIEKVSSEIAGKL